MLISQDRRPRAMTIALPTTKMERWKYSNLQAFVPQTPDVQPLAVSYEGDQKFLSSHIDVKPYARAWAQERYKDMQLWDIASMYIQDVLTVDIPADTHVDKAVSISMKAAENVQHSGHIVIRVGKNATLTVNEDIGGAGWINRAMTIELEEGATFNHIRTGSGAGTFTPMTQIKLGGGSRYNAYALSSYGAFIRDQIHAVLDGEGAECLLSGANLLKDTQHADTTILIEHKAPNCHSNQNYRYLLNDRARGVFQGKVHVHREGQGTDGYQLCNTVLLSERAEMDTKPELEIYADDVKCSHGATTAQPDETPLFYLQSRGIPLNEAKKMLLQAFIGESLENFDPESAIYDTILQEITQNLSDFMK